MVILNQCYLKFFCKETGTNNSRTGSMHLLDQKVGYGGSSAIVGGIIPIAAWAC